MIRFACPGCSTPYSTADEHAGKRTTCKACGAKFLIPTDAGESPPAAPPPLPYVVEAGSSLAPPVPEEERSSLAPPAPEPPPPAAEVPVELNPCPKCAAKMSVRPDDVGYDIQCPFCQTVFRGEAATPEPAAPAPPVPEPEPEGVDIAPCPKCRAELTVAPDDVGGEVECPFCQTVYLAEKPKPKPNTLLARPSLRKATPIPIPIPPSKSSAPAAPRVLKPVVPGPPPPKGRSKFEEDDGEENVPIKVTRQENEEDDDDEPRKKTRSRGNGDRQEGGRRRRKRRDLEPSNGIFCLILGLSSILFCPLMAVFAIPRCRATIDKVNSGIMEESAKTPATIGYYVSFAAWVLWVLTVFILRMTKKFD